MTATGSAIRTEPILPSLVGLSRTELSAAVAALEVPERQRNMRVRQLWRWIYNRGAGGFEG